MHESSIQSLRTRLAAMLSVRQILIFATLFGFVWGTVVLAVRVTSHGSPEWLTWGLLALPVVAVFAIVRGIRQMPSPSAVRALVDRASQHGGLLMTAEEQSLGAWETRLRSPADLRVHWDARRSLGLFATATAFLLAAFLFPQRLASWHDGRVENADDVRQLIAKIDLLKEEGVLDAKRAEFLKDKLEQARDQSKGRDPAKTLEAIDHVHDQVMKIAKKSAEAAMKKNEKLGLAEALAQGLEKAEGNLDPKLEKDALAELAGLVDRAAEEGLLSDKGLDPELLKHLQDLKLSPEELRKLADLMKGAKGKLGDSFDKLAKMRLIDAETLKKLLEAGECKGCQGKEGEECLVGLVAQCKRGGRGGVTEGPGHNPIAWTEGTNEENVKFKEIVLPPGGIEKSKIVGVGKADPKKGEISVSQGGGLDRTNAGGGGANAGVLLPQHRGAVERFFQRNEKK